MAHFRGVLQGSKGQVSRLGTKNSSIYACLSTWTSHLHCTVEHDGQTGKDKYCVRLQDANGEVILMEVEGIMP